MKTKYPRWLDKENPTSEAPNKNSAENEKADLENQRLNIENRGKEKDQKLKKVIFKWTQKVVICYLRYVAILVVLVAIKIPKLSGWFSIDLEPSVMITLLATTTTTIVGMMALIIASLFPKDKTTKQTTETIIN